MAREIVTKVLRRAIACSSSATVALAELIEAAFEPLLKADEDVPRWFRAGLPRAVHAAATW